MRPNAPPPLSRALRLLLKAAVVFGIFFYLYEKGLIDFAKFGELLRQPRIVTLGLAVFLATTTAGAWRWNLLLRAQGFDLSFARAFELSYIGIFFNTALPGAVSGDLMKSYMLVKSYSHHGRTKALGTILFDRILGVSALVCVAFASVAFNFGETMGSKALRPMGLLVGLLFVGVAAFYAFVLGKWKLTRHLRGLLHKSPLGDRLIHAYDAIKSYEDAPGAVAEGFAVSLGIHCALVGLVFAFSRVLPGFEGVPLAAYFLAVPLGLLVTAVPVAPAGLGTGHAAFFALFKLFGTPRGADLFNAYVFFQLLSSLLGGAVYLRASHGHPTQAFEAAESAGRP